MIHQHEDVVVVLDADGNEEKLRVLWEVGSDKLRVKSLTHPHRKGFDIKSNRIIRNEGRRQK